MFTPFTVAVLWMYCLDEWKGEQRILPPGDSSTPRGPLRPWGSKFAPRGEVKNGPQGVFKRFLESTEEEKFFCTFVPTHGGSLEAKHSLQDWKNFFKKDKLFSLLSQGCQIFNRTT
jgi:hypothetical protein